MMSSAISIPMGLDECRHASGNLSDDFQSHELLRLIDLLDANHRRYFAVTAGEEYGVGEAGCRDIKEGSAFNCHSSLEHDPQGRSDAHVYSRVAAAGADARARKPSRAEPSGPADVGPGLDLNLIGGVLRCGAHGRCDLATDALEHRANAAII